MWLVLLSHPGHAGWILLLRHKGWAEDGLVLKEENCLFPWGWLSCVKHRKSLLLLPNPFCVPGPLWPFLLLWIVWLGRANCCPYTFFRHHSINEPHTTSPHQSALAAWSLRKAGAVNVPFFKASAEIGHTGTGWSKWLRNNVCGNSHASFSIPATSKTDSEVAYLPPC